MPLAAIKSTITPPAAIPVNEMLLTGGSIDQARLTAVVRHALPDAVTTFRSDVLSALTSGPLQHGAFTLFSLAVVVAAILGLAVMLLELALGAAEREATLARLAAMGLGEGQRAWVVALEVLPAVIAAAVAAWACALALPQVLAPDLDLSVFTGSSVTVKLAADVASFAVPLAGLAVLAAVALGIEIRSGRSAARRPFEWANEQRCDLGLRKSANRRCWLIRTSSGRHPLKRMCDLETTSFTSHPGRADRSGRRTSPRRSDRGVREYRFPSPPGW